MVGSVIGPVALGFYVLAFNLSNWPVAVFSQPVRDVSPAAFARLQHDLPALRSAFVSSLGLLTAVTLPVCLVLTGAADPLITLVYGAAWAPAAAALGWLGLLAGLRIAFELVYDYFVVLGSTRVVFTVQLIWLIVLAPALYVGAQLGGIAGAAAAHVIVAVLVVLPLYLWELHRAGIAWRSLAGGVAPADRLRRAGGGRRAGRLAAHRPRRAGRGRGRTRGAGRAGHRGPAHARDGPPAAHRGRGRNGLSSRGRTRSSHR